jgi:hypothetical protein
LRLLTAMVCMLVIVGATECAQAMDISRDGHAQVCIVVATGAIEPERTAAAELQRHLTAVTGAPFMVREEDTVPADTPQIVVGPGPRFQAAFPEVDLAALKHDGIVIKTKGNQLFLAGGRPRGTLYAVYTFLEDTVGCRWWSSRGEDSFAPDQPTLTLGDLDEVYLPKLQYREAFYRDAFEGVYAARSKCNGHFERVAPEYGGHYTLLGWCHTFNQILPPEKYFKQHPEWYSLVDGERKADWAQLCLTNDEMRAEFTRNALEWIRKDPTAGMISIAQNDCGGNCQCEKCRAAEEAEGAPSGLLIQFVNKVAAEIEKEFPDFLVETLAYTYTRKAPLHAVPRRNVVVRLCTIECSFSQPLDSGPQNETFRRDIEAWSAVAPQLYTWDYVTTFSNYLQPHPNLRVLAPNIRYFVNNNCIGLFEQGDAGCSCGDLVELRAWLLAHLMWDPSRDANALMREFVQGYYGAAAGPVWQYINLIHDRAEATGAYVGCFPPDTSAWLDLETLNAATALWDQAAAAVAGDDVVSRRVRRSRMPLDNVWLQRYGTLRMMARLEGKPFRGPADLAAATEAFLASAHEFDAGAYREGAAFSDYEAALQARAVPSSQRATPPVEAEGLADDEWIDAQEGEMSFANAGVWVKVVDDPEASNGKTAQMPADHTQWAVQLPIPGDLGKLGLWHCYAVVKVDAAAESGGAFDLGVYDGPGGKALAQRRVTVEEAGTGYKTYDLGALKLTPGTYLWAAPLNNPEAVNSLSVDRYFLVKGK